MWSDDPYLPFNLRSPKFDVELNTTFYHYKNRDLELRELLQCFLKSSLALKVITWKCFETQTAHISKQFLHTNLFGCRHDFQRLRWNRGTLVALNVRPRKHFVIQTEVLERTRLGGSDRCDAALGCVYTVILAERSQSAAQAQMAWHDYIRGIKPTWAKCGVCIVHYVDVPLSNNAICS